MAKDFAPSCRSDSRNGICRVRRHLCLYFSISEVAIRALRAAINIGIFLLCGL